LSKAISYISLKGSKDNLQRYTYIAAYQNKEEAIVSENYKRTREQKKTSTVYEYSSTWKNEVLVKYQQSPHDRSMNSIKTVEIVPEKSTSSRTTGSKEKNKGLVETKWYQQYSTDSNKYWISSSNNSSEV
jgi:uncharacterized protein YodC (DUF2158 family)